MTSKSTRSLLLGLGLATAGTAYAATSFDTTVAGWTPMVTMWGGETGTALKALNRLTQAYEAFLHKTEVDEPTQKFIDKALKEFEDFDLKGFYKLLPDERNGRRELHVKGALGGGKYLVTRAQPGSGHEVGLDSRNGLADMSLLIHGKHREGKDHDSLAAGVRFGLGVGQLSYGSLMHAGRALSRLATTGDPRGSEATGDKPQPSAASVAKIKQTNPGLGSEDVDSLAILYEAYPVLGDALQGVGRLEDVRAVEQNGYFHITTRMRAEPDRLATKYPNFAKHIKKLKDVLGAKLRVLDDQGRDLVRLTVDSEKLLFGVECYVKDGQVLPFDDNQVYDSEPIDTLASNVKNPKVMIQARLNMLGIIINLKNFRIDSEYDVHDSYVTIDSHIKTMPKIKVEGRALGLFSPGFLDVFISSNIQDITEEFFRTAVKGNDGKGVESHIELGSRNTGGPGVFSIAATLEAMESWVIKFGGSVVTDRLMMNKKAEDEAKQLAADLHDAFVKDLARFEKKVGGAG